MRSGALGVTQVRAHWRWYTPQGIFVFVSVLLTWYRVAGTGKLYYSTLVTPRELNMPRFSKSGANFSRFAQCAMTNMFCRRNEIADMRLSYEL